MRIGIDLDGCCFRFVPSLAEFIRLETGRQHFPVQTCYEFYEVDWGYTLEEFMDFCHRGTDAGIVFGWGDPIPGSLEAITRFKEAGHTIHVVTDRSWGSPGAAERVTREWLDRHNYPYDTLTISKDKTVIPTDMFIDDRPRNVDALRDAGCEAWMLLDQDCLPHGREDQEGHPLMIRTWGDFERKVEERCSLDSGAMPSLAKTP